MNNYEKIDVYRGYKYAIWLNSIYGYRCGYVAIPEEHPIYNKHYSDIDINSVQLTFSGKLKELSEYYIGWDHRHIWDGVDTEAIRQHHPDKADEYIQRALEIVEGGGILFATVNDVERECHNCIDELIRMENN